MRKSRKRKFFPFLNLFILLAAFTLIVACGGSTGDGSDTGTSATSLSIATSSSTVPSDNSETTTITVTALDSSNALLADVNITITTNDSAGILGASKITTDENGEATVTFRSGSSAVNRTATITATSGSASAMIPIQIVGSTANMTPTSASLSNSGSSSITLTVTARDSGGDAVSGATVTMSQSSSNSGGVTIGTVSGTTNSSGVFTTTVTGALAGTVTVTASVLGATATCSITVNSVAETFAIDQLMLNSAVIDNETTTAMKINTDTLNVQVHTPTGVNFVTFVTSIGEWDGTGSVVTVPVVGQEASANLTSSQTGIAGVQVYNPSNPTTSDTLTVAMSSGADPAKIFLQASPTIVPVSVGTTTGYSTLTATVYDSANNPLPGWPVAFSVVAGSTSGGETLSPVVVVTAETASTETGLGVGQARTTFTSGSKSSGGAGVQIRASVVGTDIKTEAIGVNTTPSGNDVAIVIGGVAGSIAFGQATVLSVDTTKSNYIQAMSILVADSNGNAVQNATVSLSLWPIAWSTGVSCSYDGDGVRYDYSTDPPSETVGDYGTFYNEDINENLILDAGEDGTRTYYATKTSAGYGTTDSAITPTNSWGGTIPATVTTDENGVAGFNLTYPKQAAIWTVVRIRATTTVSGSETLGETIFRLSALASDVEPCLLGNSPYSW